MRERRWVLLVLTVLAVVAFVAYYGWRTSGASQRLHNLIVQTARPVLGEGFSLRSVQVGFGTVHLRDVRLDRPSFLLQADEVRLDFSFIRLLLGRLESAQMGGNALVVNPRLTIRTQVAPSLPQSDARATSIAPGERPFAWFKRVTITGGQIVLADTSGRRVILARDVEGAAVADEEERALLHLTGKLFSSRQRSLEVHGRLNLRALRLEEAELALRSYDISKLPPLAKGAVLVKKGSTDGAFFLRAASDLP